MPEDLAAKSRMFLKIVLKIQTEDLNSFSAGINITDHNRSYPIGTDIVLNMIAIGRFEYLSYSISDQTTL